ncbi:MAG: hemerythrin domain-containing protein [Candidatus Latescibacter sp.]|nr:hemerythrin domain-containing protein [Candidatus Latescibacter sp.]
MDKYLHKGIKEVMTEFPEIEHILNEFNIGCASCSVGSCLLKDIVEIHNLAPDEERLLMHAMGGVIYPGKDVVLPGIVGKPRTAVKAAYSPPMKKLVDEHIVIKRFLALLPAIIDNLDITSTEGKKLILDCVNFIRSYADRYHHAKEEEILFIFFDENLDIIATMREDHKQARNHVQEIIAGVENGDRKSVQDHLEAYGELLREHIKREDEILYPWMDRNLSLKQVGALFSLFNEVDEQFGDAPRHSMDFICSLEKQFQNKEVLL